MYAIRSYYADEDGARFDADLYPTLLRLRPPFTDLPDYEPAPS